MIGLDWVTQNGPMDNSGAAPFAAGCPLSIDISCPHQVLDQQQGTYIVVD